MQTIVIAFTCVIIFVILNGAVMFYFSQKRIRELEKILLLKTDPQIYSQLDYESFALSHKVNEEISEKKELEQAYRKAVMQDTVSDDDIKIFGVK